MNSSEIRSLQISTYAKSEIEREDRHMEQVVFVCQQCSEVIKDIQIVEYLRKLAQGGAKITHARDVCDGELFEFTAWVEDKP